VTGPAAHVLRAILWGLSYTWPVVFILLRSTDPFEGPLPSIVSPTNIPSITAMKQQNTAVELLNSTKDLKFDFKTIPPTLVTENINIKIELNKLSMVLTLSLPGFTEHTLHLKKLDRV